MKPVVVRKQTNVIIAGNGTVECARALGWTEIAANVVDVTEVEAVGYGLADNRSAELAKWDFEVVARLDKLLQEAKHVSIGWSQDELEVLRTADWTPPPIREDEAGENGEQTANIILQLEPEQREIIDQAITSLRNDLFAAEEKDAGDFTEGQCIAMICQAWLESRGE